jgi:hypothetical protein
MVCVNEESQCNHMRLHPAHLHDMNRVDGYENGAKIRSDRKSEVISSPPKSTAVILYRRQLSKQQKKQLWCIHQPMLVKTRKKCYWARCPGMGKSKAKRT